MDGVEVCNHTRLLILMNLLMLHTSRKVIKLGISYTTDEDIPCVFL
jgi:hypothetical protein